MGVDWGKSVPRFPDRAQAYIYHLKEHEYIEEKDYNTDMNARVMRFNRKIAHNIDSILDLCEKRGYKRYKFYHVRRFATEIHVEKRTPTRLWSL